MTEPDDSSGTFTNPAARLRFWLKAAEEYAAAVREDDLRATRGHGRKSQKQGVLELWCSIWDLATDSRSDRIEYAHRSMSMIDAGVEVRRRAYESENFMAPHALTHYHQVEDALLCFMETPSYPLTEMMNFIHVEGWQSLDLLDSLLSHEAPEKELSADDVEALMEQSRLLADLIRESELAAEDKLVLLDKIAEIEKAIIRARVAGTADLARAADGLTGGVIRLYQRGVNIFSNPVTRALVRFATKILAVTGVTATVGELASGELHELLQLPAPGSEGQTDEGGGGNSPR